MGKPRVTTALLLLLIGGSILLSFVGIVEQAWLSVGAGVLAITLFALLLVAHRRHWRWTAEALIGLVVVLTALATDPVYASSQIVLTLFIPVVVAATIARPAWTLATYGLTLLAIAGSLIGKAGGLSSDVLGPTYTPTVLLLTTLISGGITLASAVAAYAVGEATRSEQQARSAQAQAENAQHIAEHQAALLAEKNREQQNLLELVTTLETPALALAEGVLVAPLVGHLDSRRTDLLRERLLNEVYARRTKLVVIDISGIALVDTAVARALLDTVSALQLLGSDVTISGISANVALTMTTLGLDLGGVQTTRTPQEALRIFASQQGNWPLN